MNPDPDDRVATHAEKNSLGDGHGGEERAEIREP
jgi:hypothetical protein